MIFKSNKCTLWQSQSLITSAYDMDWHPRGMQKWKNELTNDAQNEGSVEHLTVKRNK